MQTKQDLLDECLAYIKYGKEIDPIRVEQMINEAFKNGYDEAIKITATK